jgi:archaellum component FlaC
MAGKEQKMSEALAIPLRDNSAIQELMAILKGNNMNKQLNDFSELIGHVDTMENQLNKVLGELNNVRKQLDEIKDKQHPVRTACMKMLNSIQASVKEAQTKLNEVKAAIIDGAKSAVEAFKEKGIAALNSVMNFFKVNKGLNAVRNSVDKSIASAEKSIGKIETMSTEMHSAGSHMRNIGRALIGRETKDDVKENGKIMKVVQSPFRATKATMSGIKKAVSAAIVKLDALDLTARQNREKAAAKKPSILNNVKEFKPPAKEPVAIGTDKSKKQETSL